VAGVRGYYRHPTISGDRVVFVAEDDLWSASTTGGYAHRLTANPGMVAFPRFSPDGRALAFTSRDEGQLDVHVMDADGGPARRISYLGAFTDVLGWTPDGDSVVVASDWQQPFAQRQVLFSVPLDGGGPRPFDIGFARAISYQSKGPGLVIGRHSLDPARWKRYRGGRVGNLWIDRDGSGQFTELIELTGNLADPMWIGRRIYFLSDHEGVANLYSATPTGGGLTRHTHHRDFYARFASTDGRRIVYHAGADIWLFNPRQSETRRLDVRLPSAVPQRNRRFLSPGAFLESVDLHGKGHSAAVVARGGVYTMPLWEGAVTRHGRPSRHRQRLAAWLPDGRRVVAVTDEKGEECLVVRNADGSGEPDYVERDLGRARSLEAAPAGADRVAVTNHRHEVVLVDLRRKTRRVIYRSPHHWIEGTAWSPDGRWLVFSAATTRTTVNLFLYDTSNRQLTRIGRPDFDDVMPSFDPEGKYLYFLSGRAYEPMADSHFHDYGFPRGYLPCLIPLKADQPLPFATAQREPRAPGGVSPTPSPDGKPPDQKSADGKPGEGEQPRPVEIDLDGIGGRIAAFPVPEGRYQKIGGARGRVYFLSQPLAGSLGVEQPGPKGRLEAWDLAVDKVEQVTEGISGFTLSADGKVLGILAGKRLRVVAVGWKEDKNGKDTTGRETGWVDLDRIRIEVLPVDEWRQMYSEAWRLQRDHFWGEDMGGVDWVEVHGRYLPLLERVASRAEFSDLMWEMQGELGTSHAYELGGDYRPEPTWTQGSLGADLEWRRGGWRIAAIPEGDSWDEKSSSPLTAPGLGIAVGDRLLAVNGQSLDATHTPYQMLVDAGGREVTLTVQSGRKAPRRVVAKAMSSETALRYRNWVETNRRTVAEWSNGRAGYIHIPDMGPWGFSEFHRYWRSEVEKDGLVIDVRFNRGGNVSQILLERLTRKRLGYGVARYREPYAFPYDSPVGPMVCLTNELSGSDGDIFSHTFKQHRLGPLIGTRTWGGVVGIWPQQSLVDGTVTTQPEFGTWFADVGYRVENYGTDPDIEVIITPQDYRAGRDPQLERGVTELMTIIAAAEPLRPDLGPRPSVKAPRLPT
jgi:tricorn protease